MGNSTTRIGLQLGCCQEKRAHRSPRRPAAPVLCAEGAAGQTGSGTTASASLTLLHPSGKLSTP